MADPDDVEQQRALLETYRRSLTISLEQLAKHGSAFAPPALLHTIGEAQAHIQRIKTALRQHGVAVEDHLIDSMAMPETSARGVIRSPVRAGWISAVVLLLLVLSIGIWQLVPVVLRPTSTVPTLAMAPSAEPSSLPASSPLLSSTGPDPQNWSSLVRVTSAAFLDANTCWLAKK